jgi:hypothetical protein
VLGFRLEVEVDAEIPMCVPLKVYIVLLVVPSSPSLPAQTTHTAIDTMQALSNAAQSYMGPAPGSVVQNEYKPDPSGRKMKALTWQGSNSVKVMECDVPAITQDKDVILKVTGTTICGSDLHLYHGEIVALQKNDILGQSEPSPSGDS